MRLIDPYLDLQTYKKVVKKYGGEYSLFETLRLGGIGSPKVDYISGLDAFDQIHELQELERSVCNFELLKSGLIIRLNKRQHLAVGIVHLDEIESILLESWPVQFNGRELREGRLVVNFKDQMTLTFSVSIHVFAGVGEYFSKKAFLPFFRLG